MVSATVNKNHRENPGNLVSMETEGNIPYLFLDGSFIISILEKRFFKVIETIKYSQLFIAMETVWVFSASSALLIVQGEKRVPMVRGVAGPWKPYFTILVRWSCSARNLTLTVLFHHRVDFCL